MANIYEGLIKVIKGEIKMLEIIAMISMFLDHIGLYIFNNNFVLRLIGRLALPIYGYLIIQGKDKTKDINKYIIRLLIIAIISQIPFIY